MVNYTDITYVLTNKSGGEVLARKSTSPLPSPPLPSSPLPLPNGMLVHHRMIASILPGRLNSPFVSKSEAQPLQIITNLFDCKFRRLTTII